MRHTYTPGWHLPGGGVENGMTAEETLHKELREEGNLVIRGQPLLRQVYLNSHASMREHILLYTAEVTQREAFHGNLEILEGRFFGLHELPANMHPSTERRISEFVTGTLPRPAGSRPSQRSPAVLPFRAAKTQNFRSDEGCERHHGKRAPSTSQLGSVVCDRMSTID